ncbi:MAG: hypothetical protein CMLOHMNK_01126 [Steroidobacteraceae bacterium]|nr:hypothetical protein [Steroidobacteraceae bacterium]
MTDAPTRAKGPLPQYFDDPALDQLHAALLALAAELSVANDRIDTLERLLERKGLTTRADVESYEPDETALRERAARREALVARLLRPFRDYREQLIERAKLIERTKR